MTTEMTSEQYNDAIQKAYDFAVEYVTDGQTALDIIEDVNNPYGLSYLMPADEWYAIRDTDAAEFLVCTIGEDVALDYFVVSAF